MLPNLEFADYHPTHTPMPDSADNGEQRIGTTSERTPLLTTRGSPATASRRKSALNHGRGPLISEDVIEGGAEADDEESGIRRDRRRKRVERVCKMVSGCLQDIFALVFLLLVIAVCFAAVGLIWYQAAMSEQGGVYNLKEGMVLEKIKDVRILPSKTDDGFVFEVDARGAIDVRRLLERKKVTGWFRRRNLEIVEWALQEVKRVEIAAGEIVAFDGDRRLFEASLRPIVLPLSYPNATNPIEFDDFTISIPVRIPDPVALESFLRQSLTNKSYNVRVNVSDVTGSVSVRGWNRSMSLINEEGSRVGLAGTLPNLPTNSSLLSSLVQLDRYSIYESTSPSSRDPVIALSAFATLTNPLSEMIFNGMLKDVSFAMPYTIPLNLYLPSPTPHSESNTSDVYLARVSTAPFAFTKGSKSTSLVISGHLVNSSYSAPGDFSTALSRFVAQFLGGESNTIRVRYDAEESDLPHRLPKFVAAVARNVTVPISFPGSTRTEPLFKDLQIEGMKIRLSSSLASSNEEDVDAMLQAGECEPDLLCSGRVVGEINLPEEMSALSSLINIQTIWPDILVYDGEPPADRRRYMAPFPSITADYPPSPLPANAFSRLHTLDFLNSTTLHSPRNSTHPAATKISAVFVDAPLYLLEGRAGVFQRFIGKVIFGRVRVGIRGLTNAGVVVKGLGEVELEKLPIEGAFWYERN